MSEPLTKDKIFEDCGVYDCDMHKAVYLEDLKSALEEFEKECTETSDEAYKLKQTFVDMSNSEITGYKIGLMSAIGIMKKAFPVIYEQPSGCEVKGDDENGK